MRRVTRVLLRASVSGAKTPVYSSSVARDVSKRIYSLAVGSSIRRGFATKDYPSHQVMVMPALSPTMEAGTLAQWTKKVGDRIKEGDKLALVETDKATIDFDAVEEGFLAKILITDGTRDVKVNTPIAIVVEKASDVAAFADYTASGAAASAPAASAPAASAPAASPAPASAPAAAAPAAAAAPGGRIPASPAARAAARDGNINIASVPGTGPNNRVILADVQSALASAKSVSATATAAAPKATAPPAAAVGSFEDVPVTNIRRVTAQRLTESKKNVPHYYLTIDTDVEELLKVRASLNANGTVKLSVNDFVIKAASKALQDVPTLNSHWYDTVIRRHKEINIGVAVNTDHGLFVPVIKNANQKGLAQINNEVKNYAQKAKDKAIKPEDMDGGTFTISNLGSFGVKSFSAVINPPQSGILAIGATQAVVVPDGKGSYVTRQIMSVTLSADHRVVDGAVGAQWLQAFKTYVESPLKLLL